MIPQHCAKCGSDKIIPTVRVRERGDGNWRHDLQLEVQADPKAVIFKETEYGNLMASVCGACGFTEFRTGNAHNLWRAYQEGLKR
ncbi:MAG TPA: hypothetical protein VGE07_14960 [Herpetosiphonaceae bacterium]